MFKSHKDKISEILKNYIEDSEIQYVILQVEKVLNNSIDEDQSSFKNFKLNDQVEIIRDNNPIISYGGKLEGFPVDVYNKVGKIIKFDKKTFSQKNVLVEVDGVPYWGHISKIRISKGPN